MRNTLLILIGFFSFSLATEDFDADAVEIKTTKLSDSIYMLEGDGGNIGLCVGNDGAFIIDDQFAPLTKKITESISKITSKPVQFVVNTHWHFDHTDGNENFGKNVKLSKQTQIYIDTPKKNFITKIYPADKDMIIKMYRPAEKKTNLRMFYPEHDPERTPRYCIELP